MQDLPWRDIWSADNPVEVLNEHLLLLVGRFVLTKIIRVRNKDKPWFDDQCRHAFHLKQGFALPVLEYCSTVWCSAADGHLKQMDRVFARMARTWS